MRAGAVASRQYEGLIRALLSKRGRDVVKLRHRLVERADAETIHDLRVATRRLEAALDTLADRVPDRERARLIRRSRKIRRRLEKERNAWVMLALLKELKGLMSADEIEGVIKLKRRLRKTARSGGRISSRHGRDGIPPIAPRLREALRALGPGHAASPEELLGARLGPKLRELLLACEAAKGGGVEEMHRLRIAIKSYRYMLEVLVEAGLPRLGARVRQARSMQQALGELHDLDVLIERVLRETAAWASRRLLPRLRGLRTGRLERARRLVARFQRAEAAHRFEVIVGRRAVS